MDKTQALARLTALESEALALRRIIEAPEPAASLLTKPKPGSGDAYFITQGAGDRPLYAYDGCAAYSSDGKHYQQGNIFQTKALAAAYADAIETMLLLRHQPGTVPAKQGYQWIIQPCKLGETTTLEEYRDVHMKMARLSPAFSTKSQAETAIIAVGGHRILRMFKTLHHVG